MFNLDDFKLSEGTRVSLDELEAIDVSPNQVGEGDGYAFQLKRTIGEISLYLHTATASPATIFIYDDGTLNSIKFYPLETDLQLISTISPLGWELRQESRDQALLVESGGEGLDLMATTAVPVDRPDELDG